MPVTLKVTGKPGQVACADGCTDIVGAAFTVITDVLFTLIVPLPQVPPAAPEVRLVTVIVEDPAVVKPAAVNVPVPAVVTVIVAVNPFAEGKLLL